jgi:thiopeptide-type bacteriocin biosynthesis protein
VAEAIFGADSCAVIELLRLSRGGLVGFDMTSLAALSIDTLLASLGLSEAQRLIWYRERVASRSMASDEYRRRKDSLRRLLGDPEYVRGEPGGDALLRVLAARTEKLAEAGRRLDALAAANAIGQPKTELLRSYVHLHCNRMLADRVGEEQILALLARTRYGLSQYRVSGSLV